jgi:hypothetical protein
VLVVASLDEALVPTRGAVRPVWTTGVRVVVVVAAKLDADWTATCLCCLFRFVLPIVDPGSRR